MKKIYSYIVAAVAIIAAVSCNKEFQPAGETVVYTASVDGADESKAVLNQTTKKSEWKANDEITVHDGTQGWVFKTTKSGQNVDFSNSTGFGEYRPVIAVYPKGTYTVDIANKIVKANIPTSQQAQIGTYHSPAALAVAYSENSSFAFKNAHALLKFTINMDNVTHFVFHGNNSEAITGDVNIKLGGEGVETITCLETNIGGKKQFGTWVECYAYHNDNNKYFKKGKENVYYVAVAPKVFEKGVTIKVRVNEGEEQTIRKTNGRVETKANTILDLGEIGGLNYTVDPRVKNVYFRPGLWNHSGAWYSVHFFNPIGGTKDVRMTDSDKDGIFEAEVPNGVDKAIFCRVSKDAKDFQWSNVWNQTTEVNIPPAGTTKACYAIGDWTTGTWKTTTEAKKTNTIFFKPGPWNVDSAKFVAYSWADGGTSSFQEPKKVTDDGLYVCEIPVEHKKIIFLRKSNNNLDWSGEYNRVGDINLPTDEKNCCEVTGWNKTSYKWFKI